MIDEDTYPPSPEDENHAWGLVEGARPVRRFFDEAAAPGRVMEDGQGPLVPDADDVRATLAAVGSLAAWLAAAEPIDWSSPACLHDVLAHVDELVALGASCQRALVERLAAHDAEGGEQ